MSQYERFLEQRLLRGGRPQTPEEEVFLQRMRKTRERKALLAEDLQVLRETFAVLEPQAARVEIYSYLDQREKCVVIREVLVYDERGAPIHCRHQDAHDWRELLLIEHLGVMLHCLYEADACGDHRFDLK